MSSQKRVAEPGNDDDNNDNAINDIDNKRRKTDDNVVSSATCRALSCSCSLRSDSLASADLPSSPAKRLAEAKRERDEAKRERDKVKIKLEKAERERDEVRGKRDKAENKRDELEEKRKTGDVGRDLDKAEAELAACRAAFNQAGEFFQRVDDAFKLANQFYAERLRVVEDRAFLFCEIPFLLLLFQRLT